MNPALKALAQVCREKRIEEKLLFVPSHRVGHQLGEALSRAGVPWVNLRTTPVAAHASERALPAMAARGLRRIDTHEQLLVVERLLLEVPGLSGEGSYFAGAASVPGLVRALWKAIVELRMAGLGPGDVQVDAFVVPEKGEAVQALLTAYEGFLDFRHLGVEGEAPSFGRAAALVRKAGIGWGRERWAKCLEALEGECRARAEALVEEGEEAQAQAQGALKVEGWRLTLRTGSSGRGSSGSWTDRCWRRTRTRPCPRSRRRKGARTRRRGKPCARSSRGCGSTAGRPRTGLLGRRSA